MKKLLLILLCLPMIGFGQTPFPAPCDSSISINIDNQNTIEVIYSASGTNLNMNSDFLWTYFNMNGQCIGGSINNALIDTVSLNNNLPDTTLIYLIISDSLVSCSVIETLVYDSISGWFFTSNHSASLLTYVPDDNLEAYLEANDMGNGISNDDSVTTANISRVTTLGVSGLSISSLTGIEAFTALTYLSCSSNQLTSLDVSQNSALTSLNCGSNQLTSLDVSSNIALTFLNCSTNVFTSLDLRNGNNTNLSFYNLNNPNLYSINIDDAAWSSTNWTATNYSIDAQHYFNNNCSTTDIEEHSITKELLKVTDLLVRETKQTNQPLFYI